MNRLDKIKKFLREALKDPDNNLLYIEDLTLSLELFKDTKEVELQDGFELVSEGTSVI